MHHWKPEGDFYVGDCMPFRHEGVFHLFWLIDQGHHQALGGMGGHQWAHMSTTDLVHWQHHPPALPIDQEQERSICTGSVFHQGGQFHAFYATRLPDWRQVLSRAVSDDGIHFAKVQPNPFFTPPPGYDPLHFRDPLVVEDGGVYHMFVSAKRVDGPLPHYGGCLAHLVSPDLQTWQIVEPLLTPGFDDVPECSDLFAWNGWHYLLFSNHLTTRYRMARSPFGPWLRPPSDILDAPQARVMKTAAFGPDRRIGAAWLGTRQGNLDAGRTQWGGNLLLRELVQHEDGTLGTKFVAETLPSAATPLPLAVIGLTPGAKATGAALCLQAHQGLEVVALGRVPHNVRIRLHVTPQLGAATFGLRLRGEEFADGYDLALCANERVVRLNHETIFAVDGLDRPYALDLLANGDILDVCIDGRRCLTDRCPQRQGDQLYFYAQNAEVALHEVTVQPLLHHA